jgi:cell division protein ZapA
VSDAAAPITIIVLDKEYTVACPPGEEEALRQSARVLNERMNAARETGKTLGVERLAVVTALNIVHEHLALESQRHTELTSFEADLERVSEKIEASLGRRS